MMSYTLTNNNVKKIYFVGCWANCHNLDKDGNPIYRSVFKEIRKKITNNDILIVAGDNYYGQTDPNTKKKIFNFNEVQSAFDELPRGQDGPKVYILLGNHDVDDFQRNFLEDDKDAEMYQFIKRYAIENNATLITFYNEMLVNEKYAFFFIDMKLYDHFEYDSKTYSNMYYSLLDNDMNNVKSTMESALDYFLDKSKDKQIYIGSHYPFATFITEETKGKKRLNPTIKLPTLTKVHASLNKYNIREIHHLCADTHYYENATINFLDKIKINQYIFGTGGAVLDELGNLDEHQLRFGNRDAFDYKIVENKTSYGYGMIDLEKEIPKPVFVSIKI